MSGELKFNEIKHSGKPVRIGTYIGDCNSCELMLMKTDITCPRCGAIVGESNFEDNTIQVAEEKDRQASGDIQE